MPQLPLNPLMFPLMFGGVAIATLETPQVEIVDNDDALVLDNDDAQLIDN